MRQIVDDSDAVIARWLYLRDKNRILRAAVVGANHAAERGDFRAQATLLRTALRASTAIAAAYGVPVLGRGSNAELDSQTESEMIARAFISTTARSKRNDTRGGADGA